MIPELIGAFGIVVAAVITGLFHRIRRENNDAHGKALEKLDSIAETLDHVDSEIEEIAEWQREHERTHDELSGVLEARA